MIYVYNYYLLVRSVVPVPTKTGSASDGTASWIPFSHQSAYSKERCNVFRLDEKASEESRGWGRVKGYSSCLEGDDEEDVSSGIALLAVRGMMKGTVATTAAYHNFSRRNASDAKRATIFEWTDKMPFDSVLFQLSGNPSTWNTMLRVRKQENKNILLIFLLP